MRKSIETHLSSFKICSAFKYINSAFWSLEFIQKYIYQQFYVTVPEIQKWGNDLYIHYVDIFNL